nr:RNA-directed DNA polymerase, eukaryota [Tanacetum cinerariifolium]
MFEAQVHELVNRSINISDDSLDTSSRIDLNDIEKDDVHMDKPKDTYTDQKYEYMENKVTNEPNVPRVNESSDLSYPPGKSGLIDLPIGGCFFTWINKAGTKLSKLDRFLIFKEVLKVLPDIRIIALDRLWSNHTHLIFNIPKSDFGPIPFKLYNSWLSRDSFDEVVNLAWTSFGNTNDGKILSLNSIDHDHLEENVSLDEIKSAI